MTTEQPVISVYNLKKLFNIRSDNDFFSLFSKGSDLHAVDGISFNINKGKILSLAGESGCGKTTTARMLAGLEKLTEGKILFNGKDISELKGKQKKEYHRKVQIIFQNPYDSLDPRCTIENSLMEPLKVHKIGTKEEKIEMIHSGLIDMGLSPPESFLRRLPHELSGGQRQRVSITRCMLLNPDFIVADEPVSMLDVSLRAGILNKFKELKERQKITFLFVTHDLSVSRYISDDIAIMYLGKIVEMGPTMKVMSAPIHPYTKILMSAVPVADPTYKRKRIKAIGSIPSSINLPKGCRFRSRCPFAREIDKCKYEDPALFEISNNHWVACHLDK